MTKYIVGFTLLLFSNLSVADCINNQCKDVLINTLYVTTHSNGKAIVSTSGDESKLSCEAGTKGYLTLDISDPNYDAIYALLLSSHTTQHPVQIRTSDSGTCKIVYVISKK